MMTTKRRHAYLMLAVTAASLVLTCAPDVQATTKSPTARVLLSKIRTAPEHPAGYNRDLFVLWDDQDHDGCNTRKEVLISEALVKPRISSTCTLSGGKWVSAYDGLTFTNSRQLDIDHMVPLAEAWASGAYRWNSTTREAYANDLGYARSLIAVSASSNRSKSDSDPWLWMPDRSTYACTYIRDWIAIKYRWNLAVDSQERRDLLTKLAHCSQRPLALLPRRASIAFGSTPVAPLPSQTTHSNSAHDPRFSSCAAAKAAGYGPYVRGKNAEYDWYHDRDNDGTVCE